MRYAEIDPGDLHPFVESFWTFSLDAAAPDSVDHVIPPDGAVSLSYILPPEGGPLVGFAGPSVTAHKSVVSKGLRYAGIRLRPGAAGSLLNLDIRELTGRMGPLFQVAPSIAAKLSARLTPFLSDEDLVEALKAGAKDLVCEAQPRDDVVCAFAGEIARAGGDAALGALAEKFGFSLRHIRRRFAYQTGLSPKEFARLRRVRAACMRLVTMHGASLTETSLEAGFSDQAHMAREFKQVFGNSTKLILAYLRQIHHERLVTS